jgi:hypothetical protein
MTMSFRETDVGFFVNELVFGKISSSFLQIPNRSKKRLSKQGEPPSEFCQTTVIL